MQIYLVRHALARHNMPDPENYPYRPEVAEYEDRDTSLIELGERQADLTGIRLSTIEFDAVLSSPMHRQVATANAIRVERLLLITPVITSAEGLCVATIK